MFQLLLEHGANPNGRFWTTPDESGDPPEALGQTALSSAALAGYDVLVRLLLEHGADQMIARQDGILPAALALKAGHTQVGQFIDEFVRRNPPAKLANP